MVDEKDSHEDSSNDEKDCEWIHSKHMDIWNDEQPMRVLNGGQTPTNCSPGESSMIKKNVFHYH